MEINKAIKPELESCSQRNFSIWLQQNRELCWHFQIWLPDARHRVLRQTAVHSLMCLIALENQSHSCQIKDFMTRQKPKTEKVSFAAEACRDSCRVQPRVSHSQNQWCILGSPLHHDAHGAAGGQGQSPGVANPARFPQPGIGKGLWLRLQTHFHVSPWSVCQHSLFRGHWATDSSPTQLPIPQWEPWILGLFTSQWHLLEKRASFGQGRIIFIMN